MTKEKVDALVIGAGPAGSVAAAIIHKAGFSTKIVEKEKFPRFVIGESLLPRCMEALDEAGFLPAVKEHGFQQKFGAKFLRGTDICDFNFSDQFTKGWNWTWQVPRADFDTLLASECARMGIPVEFQTTVTDIKFDGTTSTTTVTNPDGTENQIEARFLVDASGYGRVMPRLFNLDRPSNLPPRRTLFTHIKDVKRQLWDEPNRITIVVHEPTTWVWVIPFSNGNTSVGFVGNPEFFDKYSGTEEEKLRAMIANDPILTERFMDTEFLFEPRTIQSWSVTTDKFFGDGYVLTGNVTEFLDPVFSSGVTLAVSSSQRAANLVVRQLKGEGVDWQKDYQDAVMTGVDVFRTYVNGWYDGTLHTIFFGKNQRQEMKNQICSVLAGYVWDTDNPFVKDHAKKVSDLARIIRAEEKLVQAEKIWNEKQMQQQRSLL